MTSLYVISTILGVGLLLFSMLGGGAHDTAAGHIGDLSGGHDVGTDVATQHGSATHTALGLFSARNLTYFLAAFGTGGLLLTELAVPAAVALGVALGLGVMAMAISHSVFGWLRRSDSAVGSLGDRDFVGTLARVVLPITGAQRGQVACVVAGREVYLTASLAGDQTASLPVGSEVIIMHADGGIVTVASATSLDLPSLTSEQ